MENSGVKYSNNKELNYVLWQLGIVASFKNLGSKTTFDGERCKILDNYIKDLKSIIKVLYNGGNLDTELNGKQENILHDILELN